MSALGHEVRQRLEAGWDQLRLSFRQRQLLDLLMSEPGQYRPYSLLNSILFPRGPVTRLSGLAPLLQVKLRRIGLDIDRRHGVGLAVVPYREGTR